MAEPPFYCDRLSDISLRMSGLPDLQCLPQASQRRDHGVTAEQHPNSPGDGLTEARNTGNGDGSRGDGSRKAETESGSGCDPMYVPPTSDLSPSAGKGEVLRFFAGATRSMSELSTDAGKDYVPVDDAGRVHHRPTDCERS